MRRDRAVRPDQLDLEHITVGQLVSGTLQFGVAAGHDQIAHAGGVAVVQGRPAAGDEAEGDQLIPDPGCELGGFLVGAGQQQGLLSGQVVGQVGVHGGAVHLLPGAALEAAVVVIVGQRLNKPVPQPH